MSSGGTDATAIQQGRGRFRGWSAHALLLLVFAAIALPMVAQQAKANTELSIFDEWQYAERVHQVAQGDLFMRNGEILGDWAQETRACRGIVRVVAPQPDPCVDAAPVPDPNSAAADPPFYFWATGAVAAALESTGIAGDGLLAGRYVGGLWAALSMWAVFLLARAMGAGRAGSLVAASAVLLVPAIQQQYTFVTPHALDVPVGAFAALATLRFLRREWPWWTLVLVGIAVAGSKTSNVVVVLGLGVALLAVVAWPVARDRSARLRAVAAAALLGGSTMIAVLAWMLVVSATQLGEVDPPGSYEVSTLAPLQLVIDSFRFMSFGEGTMGLPAIWLMCGMAGTALVSWAGLVRDEASFVRQLAPGFLVAMVLGPILLDVMVFVTTGQYIGMQTRYGLALWPLGLGFLALLLRTRTAVVLVVVALVLYAAMPGLAGLDSVAM